ncbi:hypothetical protein [Clostridium botulinum]|uniref:hypothetical protein n=1 Tax=Clostridium botulinum TaxID=1491 RepID=UPI0009476D2D|nr:hypothetical protein [Clostridium botulinum]APQ78454.1 hypothetical protein RSJ10_1024 [Clostridium botulinum]MBN3354899.1 hypothetical protein [Clostridium botulinum]QDY28098.1 hypothetical protein CGQ41_04500 [Clostridium botulinum]
MVLVNIYGKIQPIIISKKLGVGICNLNSDWVRGFYDDFDEEILIHKHNMKKFLKDRFDIKMLEGRYNLSQITKVLGWQEEGKSVEQTIAEHLIEIQVIDFENSLLQKNNEHLDSPTCETQYTRKFIKFCSIVQSSESAQKVVSGQIPFVTYDSDNFSEKPRILNYLEVMSKTNTCINTYTNSCINTLQHLGGLIDGFLSADKDFWLLDYIIKAVYDERGTGAYHIFKVMSLIEMLIINPNENGRTVGEMERKLPQFLPITINTSQKELFSTIMRKLRNKIGHGDFMTIQQLLEEYRNSFMQNFWYDEFEYSIENWTYGNICLHLDKALANILWLMLFDKEKLSSIQQN